MATIPMVFPTRFLLNTEVATHGSYPAELAEVLSLEAHEGVFREIASWPGYEPTPLVSLPGLAGRLGLGEILYKDEGSRFGQGSFKALGGSFGVLMVLRRHLRETRGLHNVASSDLLAGKHAEATTSVTVTCASAGNHGKSVAGGARLFGCRAVIFLPARTSSHRAAAIREEGARIVAVQGSYDDAVGEADRAAAKEEGWYVVSDTAYPGYEEIPRSIMQGYTVMIREAMEQMSSSSPPTHVVLQGGVGGMAAAVCAHLWELLGPSRPVTIVVEPADADCLLESALHKRATPATGGLTTSLECLACQRPSTLAWPILEKGAHAFLTIPDTAAEETVHLLASSPDGDPSLRTQPSGAAGLAGLIAANFEPSLAQPLGLGPQSRVLVIGSEGPGENKEHS